MSKIIAEDDNEITIYNTIEDYEFMELSAKFDDCLYIGDGGCCYGIIETKGELDTFIEFLTKNRGLLK